VRAIKRYADGALGSHGAWLLEPYVDQPTQRGMNVTPLDALGRTAALALANDMQLCIHAIGDRANREVLDLYRRALGKTPDGPARRWRIEHAQHLAPDDIPRFATLGVLASMQGIHCTSDGPWVEKRLGPERAASGAYAWRALLDSGARISNGSDTPVEDVDPLAAFEALVTRRMADGRTFHPHQRMTRQEALVAMTREPAWAAFEEDLKGSLAPGKLADLVVLSQDILAVPEEQIRTTRVVMTISGGRVVYQQP
jgi:predicted amidohydrolase YtcJ